MIPRLLLSVPRTTTMTASAATTFLHPRRYRPPPSSSSSPTTMTSCSVRHFQSPAHTDNLYPGSSVSDRFKVPDEKDASSSEPGTRKDFSGFIPIKELQITYSYGQDGPNEYQVPTKVDIRFQVSSATWLSDAVKAKLQSKFCGQLTREGLLVVKSDRTRSQTMNQADALRKLREAVWSALEKEEDEKEKGGRRRRTDQVLQRQVDEERERKAKLKESRERLRERKVKGTE